MHKELRSALKCILDNGGNRFIFYCLQSNYLSVESGWIFPSLGCCCAVLHWVTGVPLSLHNKSV